MNLYFLNKLRSSGLLEKHNNLKAEFMRDASCEKAYRHVYLMTGYFPNYTEPLIKVGISNDPIRRLYGDEGGFANYISSGCAFPIFVDFAFETVFAKDIESWIHRLNDKNRVLNPDVSSGNTEWFIGLSIDDLKNEIISVYESKRSKFKFAKGGPKYEIEIKDYSDSFKVDAWGVYTWFFENSPISQSINMHKMLTFFTGKDI